MTLPYPQKLTAAAEGQYPATAGLEASQVKLDTTMARLLDTTEAMVHCQAVILACQAENKRLTKVLPPSPAARLYCGRPTRP